MSPASLDPYPKPNVAVDLAVMTVARAHETDRGRSLCVVVLRATDNRVALPGRFIRKRQTIEQTVQAVLTQKLGIEPPGVRLRLLRVFDAPDRDPRGWTLSVAYSLGLPARLAAQLNGELSPVTPDGRLRSGEPLDYDHDEIVREAVTRLRLRYERAPDPDGLLEAPYTLSELRRLHEIVLGEPLRKDTFNRRMRERLNEATDRSGESLIASGSVGRPAQMFTPPAPSAPEPLARAMPVEEQFPLPRTGSPGRGAGPHRKPRDG